MNQAVKPNGIGSDERAIDPARYLARIQAVHSVEFGGKSERIRELMDDVAALYAGKWEKYEQCQVGYHTLEHVLEVALAAVRMMAGYNRAQEVEEERLDGQDFINVLAAALFHDAGYLKDKGDGEGTGGKLAFVHVSRSRSLARDYLEERGWDPERIALIDEIILVTEFNQPVDLSGRLAAHPGKVLGSIVGTADLMAQMADVHYMERLPKLFEEFREAYLHEGVEKLEARGVKVFTSAQEMVDGTTLFFEKFVIPRFEALGRMDRYLETFFGGSRNPYMESISTNLYRTAITMRQRPARRIGEMLKETGKVSEEAIQRALDRQQATNPKRERTTKDEAPIRLGRFINWISHRQESAALGEVLLEMGEISSKDLNLVVEEQILPEELVEKLNARELASLLRIGLLLGNVRRLPQVMGRLMDMLASLLDCEASSLMLLLEKRETLVRVASAGLGGEMKETGKEIPWDKGVAGWVLTNGRAAVVDNTGFDDRFSHEIDGVSGFVSRSILAVPVVLNGQVQGVLETINKSGAAGDAPGAFDERDLFVLSIVAHQMAGSMDAFLWMMSQGVFGDQEN